MCSNIFKLLFHILEYIFRTLKNHQMWSDAHQLHAIVYVTDKLITTNVKINIMQRKCIKRMT